MDSFRPQHPFDGGVGGSLGGVMRDNLKIYLCDCENVLLREIQDKAFKQKDIANTYALSIISEQKSDEEIDWKKVNKAIIERWSKSGLNCIKEMAWKIIKEMAWKIIEERK